MICEKNHKDLHLKFWLVSVMLFLVLAAIFGLGVKACGVKPTKHLTVVDPPLPPVPPADPAPPVVIPPDPGTGSDPVVVPATCDGKTTFDALQPIIALNCAGCHASFDDLAKATSGKTKAGGDLLSEMIERIKLGPTEAEHMPAQRPSLAPKDIAVFEAWAAGGRCPPGTTVPPAATFTDFQTFESAMFIDANKQSVADQPNIRYLVAFDEVNLGNPAGLAIAKAAANKAINSVSVERDVKQVAAVAPGIWRIDISDYGISQAQWQIIEKASLLQLESFTQQGLALKAITGTRLPWLDVADANDTILRNASVYYNLTRAPATLQQLERNLGVDFAGDIADSKAALVGFNGSTLSPAANRLMGRIDSSDGFFWFTADTGPIVSQAQNIFANPLLRDAGGVHNLRFAAGEQLYSLPNGMIASFLADAAGKRLNEADPAVVHDFTANPVSPIIKNAISCFRCHAGGLLGATDKVRAAVPGQNLGAKDTQIALALYKEQPVLDQLFATDNARVAAAFAKAGLDPTAPDPISQHSDKFLGNLTLAQVAAKFVLRPEDLVTCLALSQVGGQQLGQLARAGTASHDQLVQAAAQLQRDCLIFRDPLN